MIRFTRLAFLWLATVGIIACVPPTLLLAKDVYNISLKDISTFKGKRIVGFKVMLAAANICSVPKVPVGWDYHISNSLNKQPPWNTILDASIGVGNAAVDPEFFQGFLVIEKYNKEWATDLQFNMEMEFTLTVDFNKYSRKTFSLKDISVERASGK